MSDSPSDPRPARPPQVTLFGTLIIASGVVVVLTAWEAVASIGSLDTTELLRGMQESAPFSALGLESLRELRRIAAIVVAAAAGGAVVFAFSALRRDRVARIALSVLAAVVLVAGFVVGGFGSTLLAVAAVMLWLQPSRSWFDGVDYEPPVPEDDAVARESRSPGAAGWAPPSPGERRPGDHQPAATGPAGASALPAIGPPPRRRPSALLRACLVAGLFSIGMLILSLIALGVLVSDAAGMAAELRRIDPTLFEQGITQTQLLRMTTFVVVLLAVWSLAAVVITVMAYRGAEWARIGLLVTSLASGVAALAAGLINPVLLLVAAACGVTAALLLRPEVVAWSRARSGTEAPRRDPMVP